MKAGERPPSSLTEVSENAVLTTPYAIINALSAVSAYYGDRGGAADVGTESTEPCGSTTANL